MKRTFFKWMKKQSNKCEVLHLLTKKTDTPIKQTRTKQKETLESKLPKPSDKFPFNTPSEVEKINECLD